MTNKITNDIIGKAIVDYQSGNFIENIMTYSNIAGHDEMDVPFLFRSFEEMPIIEQEAMNLCYGSVLDVGCGAGSHTLYLQKKKLDVMAIDISEGAIETCHKRGVKNASLKNIWDLKDRKFDTIISLMNGLGVCEKLKNLTPFLLHLKSLLNKKGQIVLDSSDVIYMYDENLRDALANDTINYYGEVTFEMVYKNQFSKLIHWLFVDFPTLKQHANKIGLKCEIIKNGYHYDYLVKITN